MTRTTPSGTIRPALRLPEGKVAASGVIAPIGLRKPPTRGVSWSEHHDIVAAARGAGG